MNFDLQKFYKFCSELKIETKEEGLKKMGKLLGTQTYTMGEIAKGLENDIHFFVILKGRQLGITTISLALDLYWQFTHPGWQGTLVADTEENRDMFRSTLAMYMEGLPKEYKIPLVAHNRNQMVLKNRSRIFYQIAGNKSRLGQGKAITYLHGTETASWGNEEGLASLIASLAEKNPERLYMFESTAQGFNMFHDMYKTAKKAKTQRAIFCGWWRNEFYSVPGDSNIYKVYWDGKLTGEEKEWTRDIKKLYGIEINSRQMAWWRWKMAEVIEDEALMYQEFPPTEDYAFVMTGSNFFSNSRCTDAILDAGGVIDKYEGDAIIAFWNAPLDQPDHPLLQFDNVIASPHTAGVTKEARANMGKFAAEQLIHAFDGKRPPRVVNPEVWPVYQKRYEAAFGKRPE